MPPLPRWYAGRGAIGTFLGLVWKMYGGFRLVPIAANRQPAFAAYSRTGADGPWAAHSIHVLALEQDKISALTLFNAISSRVRRSGSSEPRRRINGEMRLPQRDHVFRSALLARRKLI